MKKIYLLFSFILFFTTINFYGQEVFNDEDVYYENGLFYNYADDSPFSGKLQKVRRNGHLVHEATYIEGYIISSTLYYNRTKKPITANIFYFYPNSETFKESHSFSKDGFEKEIEYYNTNERLTLKEIYVHDTLTYRCEYKNGKKHGTEYCFDKNNRKIIEKYANGKRVKKNE